MLTTLIYRSQLAPAWQPTSLGTLVSRARQKNTNLHVTGILIFSGSQFFQVLEGDEQVVDALFSQIRNDPRHTDVVELMRDYSAYRRFRDIGMHLFDLQLNKPGALTEQILDLGEFRNTLSADDRMFKFIKAFIAHGGRYILPEGLNPALWTMESRGTPSLCPLSGLSPGQPCQFALQPIVEPESGHISSFEALIRSPSGGSPAEMFSSVPEKKRYDFDLETKAYAFSLAGSINLGEQRLAVNLLPGSLYNRSGSVAFLLDKIRDAGLKPEQIIIEVTETEVISGFTEFQQVLKDIRVAGMSLAIDDFGAGYSGLSLLTRFQPNKIKIDAELVRNIHMSGAKQAIVVSVVRCCEDLGIAVVAEGVESIAEWCWLHAIGIRLFQGFLFSRPQLNGVGEVRWPVRLPGKGLPAATLAP